MVNSDMNHDNTHMAFWPGIEQDLALDFVGDALLIHLRESVLYARENEVLAGWKDLVAIERMHFQSPNRVFCSSQILEKSSVNFPVCSQVHALKIVPTSQLRLVI